MPPTNPAPPPPPPPPPPSVSISIQQSSVNVAAGTTMQFTASVTGTTNKAVTWSVDAVVGGNAASGLIDVSGMYSAPPLAGTHTVTATSVADTTKSASSAVTVTNTSSVSPASATLMAGATQPFSASFPALSNPSVTWSVDNIAGGNSSVGVISTAGLYTAPSQAGSHAVAATDANTGVSTSAAPVTVFTMSTSPSLTTLAPSGTMQFSATIQGLTNTAVTWSVDGVAGGNATNGTIASTGLYTAPFALGPHTITASAVSPSFTVPAYLTVTNTGPGAVLTYHNDDARDGAFTEETTLTPANVNSAQFGKLISYPVDGQIYAQPLFLPQISMGGAVHDVVFVATENDSVYAFDATGAQTTPLWSESLGVPSPRNDVDGISPVLGITSTPVIDVTTNTLYVLAEISTGPSFYLHALDVTSGAEKFGGPVQVTGSVPGTGWDNSGGTITLEKGCYQRMGLALDPVTNMIYIAFGHCNHGWVLAYDKTSLAQTAIFNDTPDGAGGGLWASGGAPAIEDVSGDMFLITGVDQNDPSSGFNDSFLRLSSADLSEQDFFQPDNESWLDANDADLGSGAAVLLPDNPSSTPREVIGGGKDGRVFVVNRDNMGTFAPDTNNVIQTVQVGVRQFDNIFATPVYWNGFLYYHCDDDALKAYSWSNGLLSTAPVSSAAAVFGMHGAIASLSANGTTNGIIWDVDNSTYGTGPAVLHAYDATNVATEIYNSSQAGSRDTAGLALKMTAPTIAGGKVFVGTSNELDIYGLIAP